MSIVIAVVGGYLLGSIPFGVLAAKMGGLGDIRKVGSGNIGATNVLRTGRKDLALFTLIGDSGKGALAVLIARMLFPDDHVAVALAGGAAFAGHLFPVWLKFKGGKGVATFLGVLLAAAWPVGLLACATWLLMAFVFRISSLSALTAAALSPLFVLFVKWPTPDLPPRPYVLLAAFMAVLVFIRHHENIRRLLKGEEPKIGKKKSTPA
jgi:glycerol-3-phosphate acyltransferase PlsY